MLKNPYPGKFIVFEGLDGSGQSTQAAKLTDFLNQTKKDFEFHPGVFLTKEPTNNLIGGLIRGALTHQWSPGPECLQLLFTADRANHLKREIVPMLEKGKIVISDRYFFSTIAFGSLAVDNWEWLKDINSRFLFPDITFILKVSPRTCLERIKKDRFELELFEQEQTLAKVWQNYERLASEFENVYIIDGEPYIEGVFSEIKNIVNNKLNF